MPRIKIIKVPKKKLSAYGVGGEECPEGQKKDEFGNCVTDFEYQPSQQKIGTGIPNINTPTIKNPTKAFAPATSFNPQPPSMQIPQSGFDVWSNPTDITGQSANAMNMPKQTIVDAQGNKTTKGIVDIGNPTMYETQQTPTGPAKKQNKPFDWNKSLRNITSWANVGMGALGAVGNYLDNKRKQKEYDNWARASRLPDNYYAVNTTQDRGDYDINNGMFRPDDMGYKSKGTQANAYYPQQGFAEYGGMIHAAEGITVPGDYVVHPAFIPDAPRLFISAPTRPSGSETSTSPKSNTRSKSSGANPMAEITWEDYSKEFEGISNLGIWGDQSHKARKSDHNTGDALDLGIKSLDQGSIISQKLINEADNRNIKYIIFNNKIWNPSISNEWRPYTGKDPHTGHIHVSFNRSAETPNSKNEISYSHNNPMNVHYGDFAAKYGAVPGADDNGGIVAMFPDLETGIKANKDLMFGPNYSNLTIAEARNKWVSGNPEKFNNSTLSIVKAMGGNKRVGDLNPAEKDKLFKEFAKWEGKEAYNLIKDRQIFDEGGQNKNNMKIRIISTPDEQNQMAYGGQPPYSGQSDYGLYIGQRNLYKTMAKHPYDDVKSTVSEEPETPDNPHVLEAEGGEVITKPDGTTSKIVGNRHSTGGEKLNKEQAPEGSFIFSDTAKMKIGGATLANFGKSANSKKKYTPAELAKQYDVNKYKAILADPTTDNLQKNTAKRMLDAYTQKLAELALVQEGKKGFPQGIPDIAKPLIEKLSGGANGMEQAEGENPEEEQMEQPPMQYGGGLKKFQGINGGSTVDYFGVKNMGAQQPYQQLPSWFKTWPESKTVAGKTSPRGPFSTYDPKAGNKLYDDYVYWRNRYGKDFEGATDQEKQYNYEKFVFGELEKGNPGAYKHITEHWGPTKNSGQKSILDDPRHPYFGARVAYASGSRIPTPPSPPSITPPPVTTPPPSTPPVTPPATPPTNPPLEVPPFNPPPGKLPPYGWTQQDINNLGAAATNLSLIDKYNMASRSVQPVLPEFIPTDWRGYAATQQSGANKAADQLGTYQPGQSMASNLSFLAGQQAGALGDYISKVDQYNASGASNMDLQRANILNTASQYNASKRDYDMDYNNTADSRYKAALAHGLDRFTASLNQGITNAGLLYDMNLSESPEYYIDPRFQKRKFNSTQAYWDFVNRNKGGYQDPNGSNEIAIYNDAYDRAKGTAAEKHAAALEAMKLQGSRGRSTNTTYPYNPMRNKIATTMPMVGGYPQPGYNGYGYDYSSAYPGAYPGLI